MSVTSAMEQNKPLNKTKQNTCCPLAALALTEWLAQEELVLRSRLPSFDLVSELSGLKCWC